MAKTTKPKSDKGDTIIQPRPWPVPPIDPAIIATQERRLSEKRRGDRYNPWPK